MSPNAFHNQQLELSRDQVAKLDRLQAQLDRQDEALAMITQQLEALLAGSDRSPSKRKPTQP